jgi:hypothetical protein
MRRFFVGCVAVLFTMAPVFVMAQAAAKKQDTPASRKTLSVTGIVSMLTTASLTVKAKTGEVTFVIDKDTRVIGIGAGRKSAELKKRGKPTLITEFVRMGDTVVVRYYDMGTMMHAAEVRVTKKSEL